MDKIIKNAYKKSFSDDEILKVCRGKVKIIEYKSLMGIYDIDDILYPFGACIILYTTQENYGHWVAILKVDNKTLEWFDSYGLSPDQELQFIPDTYKHIGGENYALLSHLIADSKYNVIYNRVRLQRFFKDVNTCGRWVSLRVLYKKIPLKKFISLFIHQKELPDYYVTALTLTY